MNHPIIDNWVFMDRLRDRLAARQRAWIPKPSSTHEIELPLLRLVNEYLSFRKGESSTRPTLDRRLRALGMRNKHLRELEQMIGEEMQRFVVDVVESARELEIFIPGSDARGTATESLLAS